MTKKIRQQKVVVNEDSKMQYTGSDGTDVRVVFGEEGWSGSCSRCKNSSDKWPRFVRYNRAVRGRERETITMIATVLHSKVVGIA